MSEPTSSDKQLTPQAERVLGRLIFDLANEMRNPASLIVGFSQVTLKEISGSLNEQQKKDVTRIRSAGETVLSYLNELLDVSKLIFGHFPLYIEKVVLEELIVQAISATKVDIEQHLPSYLPNIQVDHTRIKQVVAWMLSEASKVVQTGEDGTITLTVNTDENRVTFNFSAIARESFYYYDDPDDPTLFFSRSIIEMHGGQLMVDVQEEQKRLEISFTLPIEPQVK